MEQFFKYKITIAIIMGVIGYSFGVFGLFHESHFFKLSSSKSFHAPNDSDFAIIEKIISSELYKDEIFDTTQADLSVTKTITTKFNIDSLSKILIDTESSIITIDSEFTYKSQQVIPKTTANIQPIPEIQSDTDFFNRFPIFGVWIIFILIQTSLWGVMFLPPIYFVYTKITHIQKSNDLNSGISLIEVLWKSVIVFGSLLFMDFINNHSFLDENFFSSPIFPLENAEPKMDLIVRIGYMVAGLLILAIFCLSSILSKLRVKNNAIANPTFKELINYSNEYKNINKDFNYFTISLVLMLCFMTLATSVLYKAFNDFVDLFSLNGTEIQSVELVPSSLIVAYALLNSLILCIFLIPLYYQLFIIKSDMLKKINTYNMELNYVENPNLRIEVSEITAQKIEWWDLIKKGLVVISPFLTASFAQIISSLG